MPDLPFLLVGTQTPGPHRFLWIFKWLHLSVQLHLDIQYLFLFVFVGGKNIVQSSQVACHVIVSTTKLSVGPCETISRG